MTNRPNVTCDPNDGPKTTAAVLRHELLRGARRSAQTGTRSGNAGRNTVRGPGFQRTDLSLFKNFDFAGRHRLQVRVEAFNLWNQARFGQPVGTFGAVNFGQITTAEDGRVIQLGDQVLVLAGSGLGARGSEPRITLSRTPSLDHADTAVMRRVNTGRPRLRRFGRGHAAVASRCRPRSACSAQAPAIVAAPGLRPVVTDGVASTIVDETTALVWARADRAARLPRRVGDDASGSTTCAACAGRQRSRAVTSPPACICPICRAGSASSTACASRISPTCAGGASRSPAASAPHRRARRATSRSCSRPTRWGRAGASTRRYGGMQTYASMLGVEPDLFVQPRRHHLRRSAGRARRDARRRRHLAQPAERREGQGRRDARRVPRQLPLQPAGRAHAALQRRRCRSSRCGTTTRCATTGIPSAARTATSATPRSSVALLAARARQAQFEYTPLPSTATTPSVCTARVRYGPVEVFLLDHRSYRGANSANRQASPGPDDRASRRRAGGVAEGARWRRAPPPGR